METILLGIVFLLFSFLGYLLDKKIFNPLFLVPFLWGVLLVSFELIPNDLFRLQEQFLKGIFIWVVSFCIGGLFFLKMKIQAVDIYHKRLFDIYFYIVVVFAPMALVMLVVEAIQSGPELFFMRLRMINTGIDEDVTFSLGKLGYIFNFTNVCCLLYTLYYEKVSKRKYYVILIFAFLLSLVTLSRLSMVSLFISIFAILYVKGKLKKKHYGYFFIIFFIFIIMITLMRNFSDEAVDFGNTFAIYLFAGMPAFDTLHLTHQEYVGENLFRFYYAVADSFGATYEVKNTVLDYVNVPAPTNVYTILYPFYKDFGYWGIGIFGLLYGAMYNTLHRGYIFRNGMCIILYAIILPYLFSEFLGEFIFTNFSSHLQIFGAVMIPYLFVKGKR